METKDKDYTNYIRVNWLEAQNLMSEEWFHEEAILDNRINAPSSCYLIPIELLGEHYNCQPDTLVDVKKEVTTIIYSIPEILLNSQIQPAIEKINEIGDFVKATLINKDYLFRRELKIEIKYKVTNNDLFCLGLIFGRNIKL